MSEKRYQRELKKLHGRQQPCRNGSRPPAARRCAAASFSEETVKRRSRQQRRGQGDHGQVSPGSFRLDCAAHTNDPGAFAECMSTCRICPPPGRDRHFRPGLVQPRPGRSRRVMGFLPWNSRGSLMPCPVEDDRRLRDHSHEVLAGGQPPRTDRRLTRRIDDPTRPGSSARWTFASYTWDDTVARDAMFTATNESAGTRGFVAGRDEAGPAQRDLPSAVPHPLRARESQEGWKLPKRSAKAVPPPPDTFYPVPERGSEGPTWMSAPVLLLDGASMGSALFRGSVVVLAAPTWSTPLRGFLDSVMR